ncbi:uncharacterized protein LAESUDRAFT_813732 [Laetiporus sulphureus 93-53]|uniref:Uncharacterized protein n=1 Tax=Laetiporus sulphureus 93-53 TaxID=1314785 RepID=A0A165DL42_9APHY|nr:uncharacterized protein LAESUDRAFT_813732 [Laetiporus sulphureus 93-53]KZT05121.1 hypothetical protein LAESUDRAFT_813732 [Laetiporus sulphureus 93-53]
MRAIRFLKALFHRRKLYSLLIILHAILVLIHICLVIVWARGAEHAVTISLDRAGTISNRIVFASQIFIITYTACLLLITQRLSLNSLLLRPRTLTALHDVSSAWTGLGAGLLSLWRQLSIPTAVFGTLGVTVYLGCLSILHISTPALFSMDAFNQTGALPVGFIAGMPSVGDPTLFHSVYAPSLWATTATLLPYLLLSDDQSTLGLANNTLYDILDPNSGGVGDVTVSAMTANVTCHSLPNPTGTSDGVDQDEWTVSVASDDYNISFNFTIGGMTLGSLMRITWYDQDINATLLLGRNAIFVTSFNVTDGSGGLGSHVSLSGSGFDYLQIIGCTLSWSPTNVTVDAGTRYIVGMGSGAATRRSSEWTAWKPGFQAFPQDREDLQVDSWADMLVSSADPPGAVMNLSDFTETDMASIQTFIVNVLNETLFTSHNVTLTDFEDTLNRLTASMFWAAAHMPAPDTQGDYLTLANGSTQVPQTVSRLNLNLTAVIFGLSASVILLAFALYLTCGATRARHKMDGMGVLHVLWLVADRPSVLNRIASVSEPTTDELRRVGVTEIVSLSRTVNDEDSVEAKYSKVALQETDTA